MQWTKANWEVKVWFNFTLSDTNPSSRDGKVGNQAESWRQELVRTETMEDGACCRSFNGFFSLLFYAIQDLLPRNGSAHSGMGLPISIINTESTTLDLPASAVSIFSIKVPSP